MDPDKQSFLEKMMYHHVTQQEIPNEVKDFADKHQEWLQEHNEKVENMTIQTPGMKKASRQRLNTSGAFLQTSGQQRANGDDEEVKNKEEQPDDNMLPANFQSRLESIEDRLNRLEVTTLSTTQLLERLDA